MSGTSPTGLEALSLPRARAVHCRCNEFEEAWLRARFGGRRPSIQEYLSDTADAEERSILVHELIPLEIHYRRLSGEEPGVEDYLEPFPELDRTWVTEAIAQQSTVAGSEAAALPETGGRMLRLGRFELLQRVGVGAFGAVWEAHDTELDRVVALKLPHASLVNSAAD